MMVTEMKNPRQKIFSFIKIRAWRHRLRRWYLVARQCFLVMLAAVAALALLGLFTDSAPAQGTLLVPLGITPKESGPTHQTHQFPYKENYYMLPVTSSGTTQSGYGQRTVVNKPVTVNPKRKTVIPLSSLTTQASPTPVVPEGFNARYVPHSSPHLNPPPQPTFQAQKPVYSHPTVIRRHAAPAMSATKKYAPAASAAPTAARPGTGAPIPAPAPEVTPGPPAVPQTATSIIARESPLEATPRHEYDGVSAEMDASLPDSRDHASPAPAEYDAGPPTRHETGYYNNYEDSAPADTAEEPDFARLPEHELPGGQAEPYEMPAPPQLPVPVHTRFYGDGVTEVTEPADEREAEPAPWRTNIPPAVTPTPVSPPSGQSPAVLPAGPRPRRQGNVMDLYREQTSTAFPASGGYAAERSPRADSRKMEAPADSHPGIPVNMSREKREDSDAYPTTLPPGRATGNPYEYRTRNGPSV